ncbi:hypothetical protein [Flavitalea sp.]|nr:hypothetical protein [Flavitalea sp.]
MKSYLGGYFLIKLKPLLFGTEIGKLVYSCSECINDHLVDMWSYSWTNDNDKLAGAAKENFILTDENIISIRKWVDSKHYENKLVWPYIFTDIESVSEYKKIFFSHLGDIKIIGLYFDEEAAAEILEKFTPTLNKIAEIGLRTTLAKKVPEAEYENEILIGFDLIGIDAGGSFHTFYCHNKGRELESKFGLKLNRYGLFDTSKNFKKVLDYINIPTNGFEPNPWFVAKIKLVNSRNLRN